EEKPGSAPWGRSPKRDRPPRSPPGRPPHAPQTPRRTSGESSASTARNHISG
ncbi:MAG: hypothetical protein AVDCRST_MAG93-429, partial [uncultured Chloroflexia bacterium]